MDGSFPLRAASAVAAALAFSALAPRAEAQQSPFRPLLSDAGAAREYSTPDGSVRFVFDRSGQRAALVRFDGDPEVHVLRNVGGADGVEIYRTESGDVQLRVSRHGGVTVYTRAYRTGYAATEERAVAPLAPPTPQPNIYQARLRDLQMSAQRRLGRPVSFVVPSQPTPAASGVVLDAAERASESITALPPGVRRIAFVLGAQPAAAIRGDTLIIQVVPAMGYAGRPSSTAIRTVVQRAAQGPEQ